ncbi:MAG: glycosyltransferase family 4 protein [Desulfobulbaceae bacterium]
MDTAKRVLLLSPQPFFQWRGSPIRVRFNVMALVASGFAVDLLTLPIGERRDIEGARIIRVANPFRVRNIPIGPSLHKAVFNLLLLARGLRLIRRQRYDVIHGIEESGIIAVLLGRLAGAKVIFEKHSDPAAYKKGMLKSWLMAIYAGVERLAVRGADAVICTGQGLARQVRAMGIGTPVHHIFDIPSSLVDSTPENIRETRSHLCRDDNEVLLTFVGSFAVYQGVDLLLATIPEVVRQSPHARFIIIGGSGEEIKDRTRRLQEQGVAQAVTFLGKIDPDLLPNYLAASDVLLSPRVSGVNTPLKLLDYLKAGRPVVATDVAANSLILDQDTALLAAPDAESLARAMLELIADPGRREEMGTKGRRLYESKYNFGEYTRRLAACYASLGEGENMNPRENGKK